MKSSVEALVHLHKFSNIDLTMQGIYQLRVSIFERQVSQPYQVLKSQNKQNITHNSGLIDIQFIANSEIRDQEFFSKAFVIRFCDEVIELDDICVFKVSLNPYAKSSQLILQVDLLHSDLSYAMEDNINKTQLQSQMQVCSTYQARVNELENISEHFQIEFQRFHFGLVDATLHTFPIDVTYDKLDSLNEENRINQIYLDSVIFLKKMHIKFTSFMNAKCSQSLDQMYDQTQLFNEIKSHQFFKKIKDIAMTQGCPLGQIISKQVKEAASKNFQLWFQFLTYFQDNYDQLYDACLKSSKLKQKEKWCENIFQETFQVDDLFTCPCNSVKHTLLFKQIRENRVNQEWAQSVKLPIDNVLNESEQPLIFNDVYYTKDFVNREYTNELHLVVLVNGYQGSQQDMNQWQCYLKLYYPKLLILVSEVNESQNTNDDIDIQGQRLADEIIEFIKDWTVKNGLSKLSFIGHSLGGIIIRAALPYLAQYKDQMYFLATLGSPHLGYMDNKNKLIGTGIWFMKTLNKVTSLNQLTMADKKQQDQTFMFQLSQKNNLEWFNIIALVASIQDQYVPYESARIQCADKLYEKMGKELLKNCKKVYRMDVNFALEGKSVDDFIGRTAHIKMLDNISFIRMFLMCFCDILG